MKILLIAYHFPPDRAVGGLRAAKVAEAFRQRGHEVKVITARLPEESSRRSSAPGMLIRTVKPWPGPRDFWAWLKRSRQPKAPSAPASEPTDPAPEKLKPGWKRFLLSLIWLPDDRQGFIVPALIAGLPRAWSGADIIYSSAPPFSSHIAALLVRWFSRKKLVIEFRDPWTANTWKPENSRTRVSEAIERWLERRCVNSAYRVVSVSSGIHNLMRQAYPRQPPDKFLVVRNGIEKLLNPRPRDQNGPIRIVYVGTFYFHRDPRPFLRALAQVFPGVARGVRLSLVGQCRWFRGVSIEKEVEDLGLSAVVEFRDWVDRDECASIVNNADLLLLLAQKQPAQIPNKLYEYLGTRAPILAFADDNGESAEMLREVGGHVVITEDTPESIVRKVTLALDAAGQAGVPAENRILEEWTTQSQMTRLVAALEPRGENTVSGTLAPSRQD